MPSISIKAVCENETKIFKSIKAAAKFLKRGEHTVKECAVNKKELDGWKLDIELCVSDEQVLMKPVEQNSQALHTIDITKIEPFAHSLTNALVADGDKIEMRSSDGYVNATKMCRSGGKKWNDFIRLVTTNEFMRVAALDAGIPASKLIESARGGHEGTWVHPRVAIHLATWISPEFAVEVTCLVERFITGKVTTEESLAAAEAAEQVFTIVEDEKVNEPQLTIQSAGYNMAVLGNQLYFGIPGPKLIPEGNESGVVIKVGFTKEGNERKRFQDHRLEYGDFKILDCISCCNPELVEQKLKDHLHIKRQRVSGKVEGKQYRDTELVIVKNQDEYNLLVETTKRFAEDTNEGNQDYVTVTLAKEATKQEHERSKQEHERTRQLELKLEIMKLEYNLAVLKVQNKMEI
jgi:hypothetical protein